MSSSQNNLTQGSVTGQLIRYSIPMVTTSLLQALYSMADIIIAGQFIGSRGISAINNSSQIMGIITGLAIGLTTGGNVLISQYFGAGDHRQRREATGTLLSLSALIAVVFTIFTTLFARPMLTSLKAPSLSEATTYLSICASGMFFIFGYNALCAALRAMGNSKYPFYFIAVSSVVNIVLDLLFVGFFQFGTAGAAVATVIAQGVSFFLALQFVLAHDEFGLTPDTLKLRKKHLKMIFKLGIPCSLQTTIGGISWLTVTYLINGYGIYVSAGTGVSAKIKDFCQLFISAMSNSAATMIAQTLGAKKFDRAKDVMYTAMKITLSMAVVIILLVELFAPQMVAIFTHDPQVAEAAILNLRIEIIGQVFYASFFVYHALAIGAGHTLFAMSSSFVNCILFRLVLSIILNHYFGLIGLYVALVIAPSSSVPLGFLYTKSNIWRRSLSE